jgi:3-methyladenine DNA glycosylase AlkD
MESPVAKIVQTFVEKLEAAATPERAEHEKQYLKSSLKFIGATLPTVNLIARHYRSARKDLSREDLLELAQALWVTDTHELRSVGIELMTLSPDLMAPEDLPMLERFIRESAGWAHVDEISARVVGDIVKTHPQTAETLDRWATDPDFWVRRASMLALLIALRNGDLTQWDRFCRFAVSMLAEKEFFIRKAIGWVLRDTSKKNPEVVQAFVDKHRANMAGLTLREAVKYLSAPPPKPDPKPQEQPRPPQRPNRTAKGRWRT